MSGGQPDRTALAAATATETGSRHLEYVFAPTGERMPLRLYVPTTWDGRASYAVRRGLTVLVAVDNLTNTATNLSASTSRIEDADYSIATSELAKHQILQQAATAMLAQANQQPQLVLQLLVI